MKETSLYTGNTDAIATSLVSVSENLCVQLSLPKKTLITRTLNRHRRKNNILGQQTLLELLVHKFIAIQGLAGAENPTRKKVPFA